MTRSEPHVWVVERRYWEPKQKRWGWYPASCATTRHAARATWACRWNGTFRIRKYRREGERARKV